MRIVDYVNKILGGCGIEDRKIELQGILHQISEEYHAGNLTDEELTRLIVEICKSITVLARQCGRNYPQDKCVEDVTNLIKSQVPDSILRSVSKMLSQIRSKKAKSTGLGGLL